MESGWMSTLIQEFAGNVSAWRNPWYKAEYRFLPFPVQVQRVLENGIQTGRSRQSGEME